MVRVEKGKPGRIIKLILRKREITQTEFADMLGYAGQGALTNKLKGGMPVGDFALMLGMLGYDVMIQDRESGKLVKFEDAEKYFQEQFSEVNT